MLVTNYQLVGNLLPSSLLMEIGHRQLEATRVPKLVWKTVLPGESYYPTRSRSFAFYLL